jgi:hypothetical protein
MPAVVIANEAETSRENLEESKALLITRNACEAAEAVLVGDASQLEVPGI